MGDILKYKISPTVFGVASCFFLLCSWGLSRILQQLDETAEIASVGPMFVRKIEVANYLLVFFSLCFCVHFIRGTAQLFDKHVWEIPSLMILIAMPVFNLAVTLLSLLDPDSALLNNAVVSTLLVFFSLPAFFCYYFIYIARVFRDARMLRRASLLLCIVGGVYLFLRFCDNVVFPLIEKNNVYEILPSVRAAAAFNNRVSALLYVLAVLCFFLFGKLLYDGVMAERSKAASAPAETE